MKYTQGKWSIAKEDAGTQSTDIKSEEGKTIATVWLYNNGVKTFPNEYQANADHIVKCVNTHAALINALEVVLWDMENGEAAAQKHGRPRLMQRNFIVAEALRLAKK